MSTPNNNPKGIVFILIAMMVFSVQDGIMKHIYNFVSLYEIYLIRTVISFILILMFLIITKQPIVFKSQYPILTITRVILFFFGFSSFYVSLTVLPLGTATALFFCYSIFNYNIRSFFFKRRNRIEKMVCCSCGIYWSLCNIKS